MAVAEHCSASAVFAEQDTFCGMTALLLGNATSALRAGSRTGLTEDMMSFWVTTISLQRSELVLLREP